MAKFIVAFVDIEGDVTQHSVDATDEVRAAATVFFAQTTRDKILTLEEEALYERELDAITELDTLCEHADACDVRLNVFGPLDA